MLLSDKIQIRLSECREALNTLLQTETRTAEQDTEMETLTKEVSSKEPEIAGRVGIARASRSRRTRALLIRKSESAWSCGVKVRGSVGSWQRRSQAVRSMASKPSIGRPLVLATGSRWTCSKQDRPSQLEYRADAATVVPSSATG